MTWEFGLGLGMFFGALMALIAVGDFFRPTYEHVTVTRDGTSIAFEYSSKAECDEQVRRGEFLDNNLHYCREAR